MDPQLVANIVIPGFAAVGLVLLGLCLRSVVAATRGLDRLRALIAEHGEDRVLGPEKLAEEAREIGQELGPTLSEGIALCWAWYRRRHIPPPGLFGQRLRARLARLEGVVRFIGASLTILGLLFTFIGMQQVVFGVQKVVNQDPALEIRQPTEAAPEKSPGGDAASLRESDAAIKTRELLRDIAGNLSGMELAFRSSILGIICGLIVLFLFQLYRVERERRIAVMQHVVLEHLGPLFTPRPPEHAATGFIEHTQRLVEQSFDSVEQSSKTLLDGLDTHNRQFHTDLAQTLGNLVEGSIERLQSVADKGIEATQAIAKESGQNLTQNASGYRQEVEALHRATEERLAASHATATEKIRTTSQQFADQLAKLTAESLANSRGHNESLTKAVERVATVSEDSIRQTAKAVQGTLDGAVGEHFGGLIDAQEKQVGAIASLVNSTRETVGHLTQAAKENEVRLGQVAALLARSQKAAVEGTASQIQTMGSELVQRFESHHQSALESLQGTTEQLALGVGRTFNDAVASIRKPLDQQAEIWQALADKHTDNLGALISVSTVLEKSAGDIKAAASDIRRSGGILEQLDEDFQILRDILTGLSGELNNLADKTYDELFRTMGGLAVKLDHLRDSLTAQQKTFLGQATELHHALQEQGAKQHSEIQRLSQQRQQKQDEETAAQHRELQERALGQHREMLDQFVRLAEQNNGSEPRIEKLLKGLAGRNTDTDRATKIGQEALALLGRMERSIRNLSEAAEATDLSGDSGSGDSGSGVRSSIMRLFRRS